MCFLNVSIHRNFHQNHFINVCARKKKLKSHSSRVSQFFFVVCRRTYARNNLLLIIICNKKESGDYNNKLTLTITNNSLIDWAVAQPNLRGPYRILCFD